MFDFVRKIRSAWSRVRRGEFVVLFNETMTLLRIHSRVGIGKSLFFTIRPRSERIDDGTSGTAGPFDVADRTDIDVVPSLLECMEGSTDYGYLSEREIVDRFEELLRSGSRVWVAREHGQIVGFFWTTSGRYPMPCGRRKIVLELSNRDVFVEFIFVHPDHRRRSVYSRLFEEVALRMPDAVFSCLVDSYNEPSIKAQLKIGFRPSGALRYFFFFGGMLASLRFGTTRKRLFRPKKNEAYLIRCDDAAARLR